MSSNPIKLTIPDTDLTEDKREGWYPSVPDAVAACRRYFMGGGRVACAVVQDRLTYTVTVDPNWDGKGLP